jgi:hypothetical protein
MTRRLPVDGLDARFVAPGHLVFGRAGRAFAVRFDPERLEVTGEPLPVATDVRMATLYPHMQLAVSSASLVYVPGGNVSESTFVWHGRNGETAALPLEPRVYGAFDLSDDGRQLAVQTADNKDYVLIYDVVRGTSRRLPSTDSAGWPKWSATGDSLAFTSFAEGKPYRVLTQQMDSDRPPAVIAESAGRPTPTTWSGGQLSFYEFPGNRIAFVPIAANGTVAAAQYLDFRGSNHAVSGDGRWLVYTDDATSLNIRPLGGGERVRRIAEVGVEPRWCRQCGEIVYRNGNRWYSVRVHSGADIEWEPPQVVLQTEFVDSPGQSWALSADGQRILVLQSTSVATRTRLHVMTGWLENP